MLIIEGTDLLGKTTLARKLIASPYLQEKGYIYKHFTRLPDGFNRYWGYLEHAAHKCVQDRYHMSEIAYCVARGEDSTRLTPFAYRMVDGYLRGMAAFNVVLSAEASVIEQRYADAPREEMYELDTILKANRVFFEMGSTGEFTFGKEYYRVDVDAHIHLTQENPWPNEQDVKNILFAYQRRVSLWQMTIALRDSFMPSSGRSLTAV